MTCFVFRLDDRWHLIILQTWLYESICSVSHIKLEEMYLFDLFNYPIMVYSICIYHFIQSFKTSCYFRRIFFSVQNAKRRSNTRMIFRLRAYVTILKRVKHLSIRLSCMVILSTITGSTCWTSKLANNYYSK